MHALERTSVIIRDDGLNASVIGRVIEKRCDVVDEERIKKVRDSFLVSKLQCPIEWNPRKERVSRQALEWKMLT